MLGNLTVVVSPVDFLWGGTQWWSSTASPPSSPPLSGSGGCSRAWGLCWRKCPSRSSRRRTPHRGKSSQPQFQTDRRLSASASPWIPEQSDLCQPSQGEVIILVRMAKCRVGSLNKWNKFVYQRIQLYGQWLGVVVQVVGMGRAAVWPVIIHHNGTGVAAVQPSLALLIVTLPFLVEHAFTVGSVPEDHSCKNDPHHQQGQQTHQDHRH